MPTRQDVDLARAAIDRGFLTIKESIRCLEIQRDYENAGQMVPLERILVEAEFITKAQLELLRDSLAKANALRHIGHYEIMSKVGAGGMGTVYKARDKNADRIVALKVLSPAHARNKEYIERFLREARASGRLSHPNIVQGFDAGEANGQYYFAMEFVDGITVGSMLKEGRAIPEQQALDIAIQISKALEHAEENNLIHRDIKPDNIMITVDGTAKLADLGLARLTVGEVGTREQRIFGTPYYASPEQCQGVEELDAKTDMYSFGATLFHMLAGRVPFDDETPEEIMTKHLHERRPYLKDINVQLSHGISKVVRKLMAIYKRDRHGSAADVTKDLTLVRMGRSPRLGEKSRYDSSEYRYKSETGSWRTRTVVSRKVLTRLGICAAAGLVILSALLVLHFLSRRPPDGTDSSQTQPQGATPPRDAHQIYFENIVAKRGTLRHDEFVEKLRAVQEKYPDTASAKKAEALIEETLKKINREAEARTAKMAAAALGLQSRKRYQQAIDALKDLPEVYAGTDFPEEIEDLRSAIRREAELEFEKFASQAKELEAQKKFTEAAAVYRPAIDTFGVPELKARAQKAVRELTAAEAREKARAAEEERLRAEADRERARKEREALRTACRESSGLVADKLAFGDAAKKLRAAAGQLSDETAKAHVGRAAADLDTLQTLFDGLTGAAATLKDRRVTLVKKKGEKLSGVVFAINDRRVSIITGGSSVRSIPWSDLAPETIRALARAKNKGRFSAADRQALAALFFFWGKAEEARTELRELAKIPAGKEAAKVRLEGITFLLKSAEGTLPQP